MSQTNQNSGAEVSQQDNEPVSTGTAVQISDFEKLTNRLKETFELEQQAIQSKITLWGVISIGLVLVLSAIYLCILFPWKFDLKWTWQIGYETVIRVTFIGLFVSIIAFCIKMLRTYFHLFEVVRHKIVVIKAMPTLVNASQDRTVYKLAYTQILEMLIKQENIGIFNKEPEINTNNTLVELLKEYVKKDKK